MTVTVPEIITLVTILGATVIGFASSLRVLGKEVRAMSEDLCEMQDRLGTMQARFDRCQADLDRCQRQLERQISARTTWWRVFLPPISRAS